LIDVTQESGVVIPPAQMADSLAQGELDGFCAGEPWHAVAQNKKCGRTIVSTSQIWPDHPEKALACRLEFVALYPNTAQALIRTILDASQWLENTANKATASVWLARPEFLNVPQDLIAARLLGDYGSVTPSPSALPIRFFDEAGMNSPLATDGLWFLSQFHRWGLLKSTNDWDQIVARVSQTELYSRAVESTGPAAKPRNAPTTKFIDGKIWSGVGAIEYSEGFAIKA
jgi:ABC-type nitrate/sulfonate/bicarbonate transport system substrate-binding protein